MKGHGISSKNCNKFCNFCYKILAQDEIEAVEKMMTTTENSRTENVKAGNNNKQKEIIK